MLAYGERLVSKPRWVSLMAKRDDERSALWAEVVDRAITRLVGPYSKQSPYIAPLVMAAVQNEISPGLNDRPSRLEEETQRIKAAEAERVARETREIADRMRQEFAARNGLNSEPGAIERA